MSRAVSVSSGSRVSCWPLISMVAERAARRIWTIFLMVVPVASCRWRLTARAANTTGQVGLDRLALVVEHRPGAQVTLGHAEGLLDAPQVVVGVDHGGAVHRLDRQVRDVALQAGELAGPVDRGLVELFGRPGDLQEPGLLQRGAPGGDLLRALDHGVDGLVVVLVALELPLVDDPPGPGGLTGAHLAGGLHDLPVGEVVALAF